MKRSTKDEERKKESKAQLISWAIFIPIITVIAIFMPKPTSTIVTIGMGMGIMLLIEIIVHLIIYRR